MKIYVDGAFYGFGLMIYGAFNLVFFTRFFQTAYKAGVQLQAEGKLRHGSGTFSYGDWAVWL